MKKLFAMLLTLLILSMPLAVGESIESPDSVLAILTKGNAEYVAGIGGGDISAQRRAQTALEGQLPYAVVLACSDSRVPVEHIFSMGVGDLFVVRTAGNVVGEYELGSIEYGVEHLGTRVVVVLGHTGCGAVAATLSGHAEGHIQAIVGEIALAIGEETDVTACERRNVENSARRLLESEGIARVVESGEVRIVQGVYNIETGEVLWLDDWAAHIVFGVLDSGVRVQTLFCQDQIRALPAQARNQEFSDAKLNMGKMLAAIQQKTNGKKTVKAIEPQGNIVSHMGLP